MPSTVPELPTAYIIRDGDLSGLKAAVMSKDGGSSTALTSKQQKKQLKKVGAHGMGGVGKTTIAAALVVDEDIRLFFDKIVWESLGQEPDLREHQSSMHYQLTGQELPDSVKSDREIMGALKDTAADKNVLLVLDDVWDPQHEKALNFLDMDNDSRLLVTTRIRGLLKNSAEVEMGVLPQDEALKLLLSSADMEEDTLEPESEEYRIASEIVELCGRLPLTLAIAGGMVADNGQILSEDIVEVMKESHDLEDEEGRTLEDRVISSSVKMLIKGAGKHKELVEKIFHFFAVFPEDVPVPAAVFNKMAPLLSDEKNEKKARLAVGSSLSTLLKYNLIKGSLTAGHGVFMHDVIRDFVINVHSEEALRELQKSVVNAVLAARPEPNGFPASQFTHSGTFEGYSARHLYSHIRNALSLEEAGDEPLPSAWLRHKDTCVRANVALAVSVEFLVALSAKLEGEGELVGAAHTSFTASCHKGISRESAGNLCYQAAFLLEKADDINAREFEHVVLNIAASTDWGSERQRRVAERLKLLAGTSGTAFEGKVNEVTAANVEYLVTTGFFGGEGDANGGIEAVRRACTLGVEAGDLSDDPSLTNWFQNMNAYMQHGFVMFAPSNESWNPTSFNTEEKWVEGIQFCKFSLHI